MTDERLAAFLAERVMGWRACPDRFITQGRRWIPSWRFQPATRLPDAFRLIEQAAPEEYATGTAINGGFWAKVCIAGINGEAHETSQARAITLAVARAIGIKSSDDADATHINLGRPADPGRSTRDA
jgi:hypothetical protein